jgi:hypothetical protein
MREGYCQQCRVLTQLLEISSVFLCEPCRTKARSAPRCADFTHNYIGKYCVTCGYMLVPQTIRTDGEPVPAPIDYCDIDYREVN